MGGIFESLGLSVGIVSDHLPGPPNQAAFDADITYVTAQDLGWLYLTDNADADREDRLVSVAHCCLFMKVYHHVILCCHRLIFVLPRADLAAALSLCHHRRGRFGPHR